MCTAESCAFQRQKLIFFGKAKAKFLPETAPFGAWVTSSLSYTILTKIRCLNKLPDLQPEELIGGNLHRKFPEFLLTCYTRVKRSL